MNTIEVTVDEEKFEAVYKLIFRALIESDNEVTVDQKENEHFYFHVK